MTFEYFINFFYCYEISSKQCLQENGLQLESSHWPFIFSLFTLNKILLCFNLIHLNCKSIHYDIIFTKWSKGTFKTSSMTAFNKSCNSTWILFWNLFLFSNPYYSLHCKPGFTDCTKQIKFNPKHSFKNLHLCVHCHQIETTITLQKYIGI